MSMLSAKDIEQNLLEYSLGIDYWTSDIGDGFLICGARELLHKAFSDLDAEQRHRLQAIDAKAEQALAQYDGPETFDVLMLKEIVELAQRDKALHTEVA